MEGYSLKETLNRAVNGTRGMKTVILTEQKRKHMNENEPCASSKAGARQLIDSDHPRSAASMLSALIAGSPNDDELYYLRGCAYAKLAAWQGAMESFMQAVALNPQSPAAEALNMVQGILDFYNKDIYGQ